MGLNACCKTNQHGAKESDIPGAQGFTSYDGLMIMHDDHNGLMRLGQWEMADFPTFRLESSAILAQYYSLYQFLASGFAVDDLLLI